MRTLPNRDPSVGTDADESVASNAGTVQNPGAVTPGAWEKRLRKVMSIIESQPSRSVRELAGEVHLTPTYLQRLFKQEAGVHVSDLLVEHRLLTAANLLTASELPIKQIAHAVGYMHHSSFVRAFHRRFAQSPRQYRQRGEGVLS